jgi:hypothetical protein
LDDLIGADGHGSSPNRASRASVIDDLLNEKRAATTPPAAFGSTDQRMDNPLNGGHVSVRPPSVSAPTGHSSARPGQNPTGGPRIGPELHPAVSALPSQVHPFAAPAFPGGGRFPAVSPSGPKVSPSGSRPERTKAGNGRTIHTGVERPQDRIPAGHGPTLGSPHPVSPQHPLPESATRTRDVPP